MDQQWTLERLKRGNWKHGRSEHWMIGDTNVPRWLGGYRHSALHRHDGDWLAIAAECTAGLRYICEINILCSHVLWNVNLMTSKGFCHYQQLCKANNECGMFCVNSRKRTGSQTIVSAVIIQYWALFWSTTKFLHEGHVQTCWVCLTCMISRGVGMLRDHVSTTLAPPGCAAHRELQGILHHFLQNAMSNTLSKDMQRCSIIHSMRCTHKKRRAQTSKIYDALLCWEYFLDLSCRYPWPS